MSKCLVARLPAGISHLGQQYMQNIIQQCEKKHQAHSNKKKTFNGPALPDVAMNKNCSDGIIYLVIIYHATLGRQLQICFLSLYTKQ